MAIAKSPLPFKLLSKQIRKNILIKYRKETRIILRQRVIVRYWAVDKKFVLTINGMDLAKMYRSKKSAFKAAEYHIQKILENVAEYGYI